MGPIMMSGRVGEARSLAETLLAGLEARWQHTIGVARRAAELTIAVDPADRDSLLVAAWLHDIGYSPALRGTGFHPLDGAAYLERHGWPRRICGLVAHHSGADFVARVHDVPAALSRYPNEQSPLSDALTYADQTVGHRGQPLPIRKRMAQMLVRRGPESAQRRVHHLRAPYLFAVAERVEQRLAQEHVSPAGARR